MNKAIQLNDDTYLDSSSIILSKSPLTSGGRNLNTPLNSIIEKVEINVGNPYHTFLEPYSAMLIIGFLNMVGGICYLIQSHPTHAKIIDLITGEEVLLDRTHWDFEYNDNHQLTITAKTAPGTLVIIHSF